MKIHPSWENIIGEEFKKPYFKEIQSFLIQEAEVGETVYPQSSNIFHAFNTTPFDELKVVILGQDPYHGPGQAHGMSFSVPKGIRTPPSLKNIYKEIHADLGIPISENGNLESWAKQGVLLMNAILTVQASSPASHSKIGWQTFTDAVIQKISDESEGIIFLLWGNFAQTKKELIDSSKHYVLESPHPSPFSAHKGFFGCGHFSKVNEILKKIEKKEIDWEI